MYKLKNKFRQLFLTAATVGAACLLAGCGVGASAAGADESGVTENQSEGNGSGENSDSSDSQKLQVVATIFPEYDWVRQIAGEEADQMDITMLLDNGVDLHSYQPTAEDIMKVSDCDLFVYVGGESDAWVDDALKQAKNKDMQVVNLLDVLGNNAKEEEVIEGMEPEEEKEGGEEEEPEYDEHVWLSVKNAEVLSKAIADALEKADPDHKDIYQENASAYSEKLKDLDAKYQEVVDGASQKTLLFGDRFPFRYLVDDYDLSYYAAFSGCSAESEASFKTVTFLAGKVDELGVKSVLTMEKSDDRIAQTVIENTKAKDQKILQLNSMQSITSEEIADGATYLSVMEDNLGVLKEALN